MISRIKKIIALSFFILFSAVQVQAGTGEIKSSVPENPYNRLANQLEQKDKELNQREKSLDMLQAKLEQSYLKVFAAVGVLFFLILLNYVLDYRRRKMLLLK